VASKGRERDAGKYSLWIRQIVTSSNLQVVVPQEEAMFGLRFSPDGNFLYCADYSFKENVSSLYRLPVLGGTPARILTDINSAITFSPDGKRVAFTRVSSRTGDFALIVANADGSEQRVLA